MSRPRSYGSPSNKMRRQESAKERAAQEQKICMSCGSKHRYDRDCPMYPVNVSHI